MKLMLHSNFPEVTPLVSGFHIDIPSPAPCSSPKLHDAKLWIKKLIALAI
jgi:hypothetical protein